MSTLNCLLQLQVAAALLHRVATSRTAREVHRLTVHRERRHPRKSITLGGLDFSAEEPVLAPTELRASDFRAGVADIERVHPTLLLGKSEEKFAHGANSSLFRELRKGVSEMLRDVEDVMYLTSVQLGTPLRTATLILDTGSSDFWIKPVHNAGSYSTANSASFQGDEEHDYHMEYGQGKVSGYMGVDRCCLDETFCLDKEPFIVAIRESDVGNEDYYNGLLGLGFPYLAECEKCSLLFEVLKTKKYANFAFGLALHHEDKDSYIEFGELESLKLAAENQFGPGVTMSLYGFSGKAAYWMTKPQAILAGDTAVSDAYAILDSGTSLIAIPPKQYKRVWKLLSTEESKSQCSDKIQGGQGLMLCICGTKLNPLSFQFQDDEGSALTVELGPDDILEPEPIGYLTDKTAMCRIAISRGPKAMPFWLLGDVFLRHVYAVHDVQNVKIHLYPAPVDSILPFTTTAHPANHERFPMSQTLINSRIGLLCLVSMMIVVLVQCCLNRCRRARQAGVEARGDAYVSLLG